MPCRWCSTEKALGSECKPECRLWQFVEDNEMRPWIAELLPIVQLAVRDLRALRGSRPTRTGGCDTVLTVRENGPVEHYGDTRIVVEPEDL